MYRVPNNGAHLSRFPLYYLGDGSGGLLALPTYEYRCLSCEHQFERFQRMSDDPVKECEVCGAPVKRLLFPVAIHFKGNGFYSTDYARRSALGSSSVSNGNGDGAEKSCSSEGAAATESPKVVSSGSSGSSGSSESGNSTPVSATAKND
jgi:putative FmdB family regulatory protein